MTLRERWLEWWSAPFMTIKSAEGRRSPYHRDISPEESDRQKDTLAKKAGFKRITRWYR